jgi:hypothetical protein
MRSSHVSTVLGEAQYDRAMAEQRRTVVLLEPARIYGS